MLLPIVWNRSNFSANNSQHFFLFRDRRSVAQQCWIRLHSSSNIVGATHTHYAWITKTYGLYSTHDALQVLNLLGVFTPLLTRTQQLPTLLAQQCWELLRPFARSLRILGKGNLNFGSGWGCLCSVRDLHSGALMTSRVQRGIKTNRKLILPRHS